MLGSISLESLQKAVVYGSVISVAGSTLFYYLTQRNLCSGPYYTEAVAALKRDKRLCNFLGEPVRVKVLKLSNKENRITERDAQVLIPVAGTKTSGILKSNASVKNGKWELDSLTFHHVNKSVDIKVS